MGIIIESDGQKGRQQLAQALKGEYDITFLLFGADNNIENIYQIAEKSANRTEARQLIWLKNSAVLSDEKAEKYRLGKKNIIGCTLDVDDEPVQHFEIDEINDSLGVELAYVRAEKKS